MIFPQDWYQLIWLSEVALPRWSLATLLKKNSMTGVFFVNILWIFLEILFYRTPINGSFWTPDPLSKIHLAGNNMFKVNNRNTRTRYEICSKLTTKTLERRQWRRSGVVIVNFEHISHLGLVILLLTLSK